MANQLKVNLIDNGNHRKKRIEKITEITKIYMILLLAELLKEGESAYFGGVLGGGVVNAKGA